ncbi:MAG: DUF438 domain-containing protein, partial [Bacteroidales bacterium]|nr:DUF438 domain-containing protein [Bacteroidales bacterium]
MSEYLNNAEQRKKLLKHMLEQLHKGEAPEQIKSRIKSILPQIPYSEVVEVEQQLIAEGITVEEIIQLCDVHTQVLDGKIDTANVKEIPVGHPIDILRKENKALESEILSLNTLIKPILNKNANNLETLLLQIRATLNNISDIEKHYLKKELLLFPYLEKHGITGPPKVMWGKHDEVRELLKNSREALKTENKISKEEVSMIIEIAILPVIKAIEEMIIKEEQILFPMSLDLITLDEWYQIYQQIPEIGYCLYDPQEVWTPEAVSYTHL